MSARPFENRGIAEIQWAVQMNAMVQHRRRQWARILRNWVMASTVNAVVIHFSIQHHPWAKYLGAFHDIKGTILFERENVFASSVQAEIAAESVDTSNKARDAELQAHGFINGWE